MTPELRDIEARAAVIEAQEALEQRVAALEDQFALLTMPSPLSWAMTDEQAAQFKEEFEAAAKQFPQHEMRLRPSPPPLTPDEIRQLLRESVTVVKPGEVLFFTCGDPNYTPMQIREIQDGIGYWLADNAPDIKVLVLPHGEMAAAEAPRPDFMKDVRVDTYRHEHVESVKLTHLPTGIVAVAPSRDEAVAKLALSLAARGDITINDGRRALGLPEWEMPEADTAQALPSA